jgi:hypothetical protein
MNFSSLIYLETIWYVLFQKIELIICHIWYLSLCITYDMLCVGSFLSARLLLLLTFLCNTDGKRNNKTHRLLPFSRTAVIKKTRVGEILIGEFFLESFFRAVFLTKYTRLPMYRYCIAVNLRLSGTLFFSVLF